MRGDAGAGGNQPAARSVGQVVAERIAGQLQGAIVRIEDFKPVVVMAIGRVRQRRGVRGHPFIDEERERRPGGVVGRPGRCEEKNLSRAGQAIGIEPVGTVGGDGGVVDVIQDGRVRVQRKDQRK